ncbi:MAG: tRNA lysidine(34) synthetase TilS [Clostridia bacterium]|nr:tRNA lysidine(34) synthetase TilS [Clostridia bacterium]
MKQKVLDTIKKYNLIENGDKIILGVSGGPDSMCMLNILNEIKNEKIYDFEIIVAHINHQIREEANDDEAYVKEYCDKNQIKCYIKRIDVKQYANNNKIGLEESGRNVRYKFFDEIAKENNSSKIATAHNKNDKVETIIMNELRGTGISGLRGIEPIRDNKYIRPIIECQRNEIEKYCEDHNLQPRIDKTNFINDCTRNKIRNVVLPYIKNEFNPNIIETIDRLSEVANETEEFLQNQTVKIYDEIKMQENILNLKEFNKQDLLIKKRIILYTINKVLGNSQNIEKVNIDDIIKLCENNIGNKYLTPNKNIKILVNKGKIFFESLK